MPTAVSTAAFTIGAWLVSPALDEISCSGRAVKLEPRAMRVLLYLAAQPGRVVGVDELFRAVWPTVVVTPQSVYSIIAQLRHALGDSIDAPSYIATVARKGYRLLAVVAPLEAAAPPSTAPTSSDALEHGALPHPALQSPARASGSGRATTRGPVGRWVIAAAVVVTIIAGGTLWQRYGTGTRLVPSPALHGAAAPRDSIAVLPFLDMSANKDQQYFADGMTEELIDALTRISTLRVAARASAFYFKGKQTPIGDIAKSLKVAHVLEGSIRREGSKVRITVQLSDALTGSYLWSQTYDRDLRDVLQVQTEVATSVTRALKVTLTAAESAKLGAVGTVNVAAYDAYLRGEERLLAGADRQGDARAALALFDEAVALDPDYAVAHAGRARALDILAVFHTDIHERDAVRRQALAAGERAVELAPELGEAHVALGITRAYGLLDFAGAAPEFERALALAPGSARVQRLYAEFSSAIGRHEAAVAAAQRATSLDPQDYQAHMTLARTYFQARRFAEALAAYRDAAAIRPGSNWIEGNIAGALIASRQYDEARRMCESRANGLGEDNRHWCLSLAYHYLGRQPDAERELALLKQMAGDEAAVGYAQIYASWGESDEALRWLAKAEKQQDPSLQSLRGNYLFDTLRSRPDFMALEARLNLPR